MLARMLLTLLLAFVAMDVVAEEVTCESIDGRRNECAMNTRGEVRLIRQLSNSACVEGRSWGLSRHSVWVDSGCRAVFASDPRYSGGYGGRDEWRPGPGWDSRFVVRCASQNYAYNFCAVDLGRGGRATIERQISNSACIEGRTWGWNRAGIWVNEGCEADFSISRRWR